MSVILVNGIQVKPMMLVDIDNPPKTETESEKPLPTAGAMATPEKGYLSE